MRGLIFYWGLAMVCELTMGCSVSAMSAKTCFTCSLSAAENLKIDEFISNVRGACLMYIFNFYFVFDRNSCLQTV